MLGSMIGVDFVFCRSLRIDRNYVSIGHLKLGYMLFHVRRILFSTKL